MKLSNFKYNLPEELIAQRPVENRDESRLMVVDLKTGKIEHRVFKEVLDYFNTDDVFVFNDTKVFPARLFGHKEKTGAKIEVFLLRELNREMKLWDVLVSPARKIRIGNKLYFGEDESLVAEVFDNTTSRGRTLRFLYDGDYEEFRKELYALGETPLPNFIKRSPDDEDRERYQTIYAKNEGAVATPTAGMHFSRELLKRMEIKGVNSAFVTLHIGLGNFRSVDVEALAKHKVDSEQMLIDEEACKIVNTAKTNNHKVCAVGTTVLRALESTITADSLLKPFDGWTNRFIFPPYDVEIPDAMISNLHMPYSTMLMSVTAFGGHEVIMDAYKLAVKEKYRFGTYGDAMLILR
ncbi:MAG: tRNA preQ1(34) S-adenosylmethionine ribosyltransferase-isomerase QueA [Flavobacteriaceae bacterium]|nr:tRNA preQ1(34) S-adenosylmethionine ribosyltransferase-isomerase QueA [Flavobacteriaceae bacterium]